MGRNSAPATTAANSANNLSNAYAGNAQGIYSGIEPELENFAAAPPGMNPADYAASNTQNQQTAGGTEAATVGQGGLLAARSRNAGAPAAAVASGARTAGETLSKANLKTQLANESLKQHQQGEGISGLENLYGENLGGSINALGQVASNVNANVNQENESYDPFKYIVDPLLQAAGSAAAGH